jgi:hypothetical protein
MILPINSINAILKNSDTNNVVLYLVALESGKFEQKDGYLVPKTAEKGDVQDVRLENLKSLSQYVVFLEQK